jgi:DNA (cytosine-5)-methyltransferase 1
MARARALIDPVESEAPLEEVQSRPMVVDLVARAGRLSHGFTSLGFRMLLALDQYREAMKTYRLNHPELLDERIVVDDIENVEISLLRKLVGRKRLDVLVGSPPCPGYSAAGTELEWPPSMPGSNTRPLPFW